MIGIYHNKDLDGFCCGAIIQKKYPGATMVGHDYGQPFNLDPKDEAVIMADISLPMPQMAELGNKALCAMTWVDHHVSAINEFKKYRKKNSIPFSFVLSANSGAACELLWNHIFPDKGLPLAVKLLSMYDSWQDGNSYYWENHVMPFQYGMRVHCNSLETFPTEIFEDEQLVMEIIERGKWILRYQENQDEFQCTRNAFECRFDGLSAICLNSGRFNSNVFNGFYDPEKHDIMVCFQFTGINWKFSLYTIKDAFDCSQLAKKYGGGGHKKAAGFVVDNLGEVEFDNIITCK